MHAFDPEGHCVRIRNGSDARTQSRSHTAEEKNNKSNVSYTPRPTSTVTLTVAMLNGGLVPGAVNETVAAVSLSVPRDL